MKKYSFHIITIVLFSFFLQSCSIGEISEKDENSPKELIYNYTESALYEMLYCLDLAVQVNAYANATTNSQKDSIRNIYFSSASISQNDGKWILENKKEKWIFESNDLRMEDIGAVWKISLTKNSGENVYINSGDFVITTTGDKQFSLHLNDIQSEITNRLRSTVDYDNYFSFKSSGDFSVTASTPDSIQPFYSNYAIESGTGRFTPDKVAAGHYNITVDYTVKKALNLEYNAEKYLFSQGSILFGVLNAETSTTDSFEANIYTIPGDWNVKFN